MITRKVILKEGTTEEEVTRMCNGMGKEFLGCQKNADKKWEIVVGFDDEIEYLAWLVAKGIITLSPVVTS